MPAQTYIMLQESFRKLSREPESRSLHFIIEKLPNSQYSAPNFSIERSVVCRFYISVRSSSKESLPGIESVMRVGCGSASIGNILDDYTLTGSTL